MSAHRSRNRRTSTYRPRTEAQKQRRRELAEARLDDRAFRPDDDEQRRLVHRLDELESALRDQGKGGVHGRRHTRPLEEIVDDAERFGVLKARVERLEALWAIDRRRRETRGKIIIGGAVLAEVRTASEGKLLQALVDILDRRVDGVRDRLTVRNLLGGAALPLRRGGDGGETEEDALRAMGEEAEELNMMAEEVMAEDESGSRSSW